MSGAILETPTIGELNEQKKYFFIPDYQRGYRWTKTEVEALLEDVLEFGEKSQSKEWKEAWYCLQPIVARKMKPEKTKELELDEDHDWYEIIDGQQRITTIFLITRYINKAWRGLDEEPEPLIIYQTRNSIKDFLLNLAIDQAEPEQAREDIDSFHIWKAFQCIHTWAKKLPRGDPKRNRDVFITTFLNNTRAIWYETEESDPIEVFTRLNMYKIPLTNAELVKALLLNRSNFAQSEADASTREEERIRLRQVEIANDWDSIEARLHDDAFWCFLVDPNKINYDTRIELLLDLLSDKNNNPDQFFTFSYFRNKLGQNASEIVLIWKTIKDLFMVLEGWYHDRVLYHRIGYLIAAGRNLASLLKNWNECSTKVAFQARIGGLVSETMQGVNIDELSYSDEKLRQVLLLHNVETVLRACDDTARFPFDLFKNKNKKWDKEHVHALADDTMWEYEDIKDWCKENLPFIDPADAELVRKFEELMQTDKPDKARFHGLYREVITQFGSKNDEDENSISNIVLLDSGTNRSYKAAVFPHKRARIIEVVKKGGFVPICTRNVFLKFYYHDDQNLRSWGDADRVAYLKDMKEVLGPFLPKTEKKEGQ